MRNTSVANNTIFLSKDSIKNAFKQDLLNNKLKCSFIIIAGIVKTILKKSELILNGYIVKLLKPILKLMNMGFDKFMECLIHEIELENLNQITTTLNN